MNYPYLTRLNRPFRLVRTSEDSWDVFEQHPETDYGAFVGFFEKQYDFDGCETEQQAADYWTKQDYDCLDFNRYDHPDYFHQFVNVARNLTR
jgi:hypothetical protein